MNDLNKFQTDYKTEDILMQKETIKNEIKPFLKEHKLKVVRTWVFGFMSFILIIQTLGLGIGILFLIEDGKFQSSTNISIDPNYTINSITENDFDHTIINNITNNHTIEIKNFISCPGVTP